MSYQSYDRLFCMATYLNSGRSDKCVAIIQCSSAGL